MANEIQITASLTVYAPTAMSSALSRAFNGLQFNQNTYETTYGVLTVTTAGVAIPLGGIAAPHWFVGVNQDPTNYLQLKNGSGGAVVVRLYPGEVAFFPWDNGATPYAVSSTASTTLEYLLLSY